MDVHPEKAARGRPWALVAVLVGILGVTVAMCAGGSWLFAHSIQQAIARETGAYEASLGPMEVRSEPYRVVMRRTADEPYVELFERPLAQHGFAESILRRVDTNCDAQLRVRTVGAEAEVVPWMDFATNETPTGEPTHVQVAGLDHEGTLRTYVAASGVPFSVVGFVREETLFTLDLSSDDPTCISHALASLELLPGPMQPPTPLPVDAQGPTFRIVDNRFESFVSGLVVEAPAPFVFATTRATNLWLVEDEAVLLHPNGSEIHLASMRLAEAELVDFCGATADTTLGVGMRFGGAQRVFQEADAAPYRMLSGSFCAGRTLVTLICFAPTLTRAEEALRALEDHVRVDAISPHDAGGNARAGFADWSFRGDTYAHTPSGMTWRRPPLTEVRTLGTVELRTEYPDTQAQFEFQRRDLSVNGAGFAHPTALSSAEHHEAFVVASLAQLDAPESAERSDQPFALGTCIGTRSDLSSGSLRIVVATCVHEGMGIALEVRVLRTELEGALAFQEAALTALSREEVASTPSFSVDGATLAVEGACAHATQTRGRLTLDVTSCVSWTGVLALSDATYAADQRGSFRRGRRAVARARVFASTTPVTSTTIGGFPAHERRSELDGHMLRVYTVLVDAEAYVVSIRGRASTPERDWSELLATVHIDP